MTEDIFDHFSGNSPRKIKPLEQDDLFDDLMPKPQEEAKTAPIAEEETAVPTSESPMTEPKPTAAEPVSSADDVSESVASDETAAAKTGSTIGTHWDSLMSSLGLGGGKRKEAEPAAADTSDKPAVKSATASAAKAPKSKPAFEMEVEPRAEEKESAEVLSEMFASRDDESFEKPEAPKSAAASNDPFAAFHQPTTAPQPVSDDELDTDDEPESTLVIDDDFVEFDVKELDGGRERAEQPRRGGRNPQDSERQPRRGRRPARGRGRDEGNAGDDRPKASSSDQVEENSGGRGRKRRGGNRSERNQEDTRSERSRDNNRSERNRDESRSERSRDGNRSGRGRDENRSHDRPARDEVRGEGRGNSRRGRGDRGQEVEADGKKKPKVATWEDAISGVIDQNIKRHKSGSGRSGGGRRRRNNNR